RVIGKNQTRQEYHVVTINPIKKVFDEQVAAILAEHEKGTHASPGEHTVRGHWCESKRGIRFWRNPHKRGSGPCKTIRTGYTYYRSLASRLRAGCGSRFPSAPISKQIPSREANLSSVGAVWCLLNELGELRFNPERWKRVQPFDGWED